MEGHNSAGGLLKPPSLKIEDLILRIGTEPLIFCRLACPWLYTTVAITVAQAELHTAVTAPAPAVAAVDPPFAVQDVFPP
jgi:hypothetical protein